MAPSVRAMYMRLLWNPVLALSQCMFNPMGNRYEGESREGRGVFIRASDGICHLEPLYLMAGYDSMSAHIVLQERCLIYI